MDWIIWLIVIAVIVGIVWRLLNRNNDRAGSGSAGTKTTPAHDATQPPPDDAERGASPTAAGLAEPGPASAPASGLAGMPQAAEAGRAEPGPEPESELEPEPQPVNDVTAEAPGTGADAQPSPRDGRLRTLASGRPSGPRHRHLNRMPRAITRRRTAMRHRAPG